MTRQEYEYLQERFSKLLAKKPYGRANEKEAYRSGVLAAKSVLKDVYEHSDSAINPYENTWAIENGYI
jgi:hypothetical protein